MNDMVLNNINHQTYVILFIEMNRMTWFEISSSTSKSWGLLSFFHMCCCYSCTAVAFCVCFVCVLCMLCVRDVTHNVCVYVCVCVCAHKIKYVVSVHLCVYWHLILTLRSLSSSPVHGLGIRHLAHTFQHST